jgi:hypothetical protein
MLPFNHLKAVSIGPLAIRNQVMGKVHSIFRRVVNIVWADGSLSSISRIDICNGSANIVTDLPASSDFVHYGIEPGASVRMEPELKILYVGAISISLNNATLWQSPLAHLRSPLPPHQVKANLKAINNWLDTVESIKYGLNRLFPHLEAMIKGTYLPSADTDPVTYLAAQAINNLLPALCKMDKANITRSAACLIGLGPGLTPSGDDYLAGLMLSLTACSAYLPESIKLAPRLLTDSVIQLVPGLTNDLSRQMLEFAAKGMGSELMENMVFTLFFTTQIENTVLQSAMDLSCVGASSGFDQLLGIMSGAYLYSG